MTSNQTKAFLSVRELADRYAVPVATVHQWLYRGTAPRSHKIGRYRRFRIDDVLAWEEERADFRGSLGRGEAKT